MLWNIIAALQHRLTYLCISRDWDCMKPPVGDQIILYTKLPSFRDHSSLKKLAILKVNGGLGTSMGLLVHYHISWPYFNPLALSMIGPKCALEVKNCMMFLNLIVHQIEHLNTTNKLNVPLLLMTSFNMQEELSSRRCTPISNCPSSHSISCGTHIFSLTLYYCVQGMQTTKRWHGILLVTRICKMPWSALVFSIKCWMRERSIFLCPTWITWEPCEYLVSINTWAMLILR